jgi:signal transduction histidine kinase
VKAWAAWSLPAAVAVKDRLFLAVAVLRAVVLVNAVAVTVWRADEIERPWAAGACLVVMSAWSAVATWAYATPRRRTFRLLAADLVVAMLLILVSPFVNGDGVTTSVPGFWVIAPLAAWAIQYRWLGGLAAGVLLAAADLARQDIDESDYPNTFLLLVGGAILGFMCQTLQEMATERDAAERAAAVATERARLARAVHDGVLQVLALVQRGGGELAPLAGEQERRLRALIRAQDDLTPVPEGTADLVSELAALERRPGVTVSTPGTPVELPAAIAHELVAAVGACLDNVRAHVGEDAPSWVLLQAFPDRVEVSVRDDGPGIPAGRLDEAVGQGRLGVSESIRGRIAELGGTADLATGTFGTEWEIVVPRERA